MSERPDGTGKTPVGRKRGVATGDKELSNRLDNLGNRLSKHQQAIEIEIEKQKSSKSAGIAQAMKLSSEFIAAIIVGVGIGYAIDTVFGTSPWGMIVFLFLGFGAGVLNALRAAGMVAESNLHLGATIDPKNDE